MGISHGNPPPHGIDEALLPDLGSTPPPKNRRVFLLGATGTIGRATARALAASGRDVVCLVRPSADAAALTDAAPGIVVRAGEATDPVSLRRDGFAGERFDALVSCLASRTGAPKDAWAVDYAANLDALTAAQNAGVSTVVHLSAICVQRPRLAFQHAKRAYEDALAASGVDYAIVRPTAFFKSLSGQIDRVRAGKPFMVFGDGAQTACKPISDADLAQFIVERLDDAPGTRAAFPIGGPGPAMTPREQGAMLFDILGREPQFQSVPTALFDVAAGVLGALGRLVPPLAEKAEFARIAKYYACESMLVYDADAGRYDADATPSFGTETLADHYAKLVSGAQTHERGAHTMFDARANAENG